MFQRMFERMLRRLLQRMLQRMFERYNGAPSRESLTESSPTGRLPIMRNEENDVNDPKSGTTEGEEWREMSVTRTTS